MGNPVKILIVEDDMIVAADVSMMLDRMHYEVSGITPRGEDALKSIESTRPDLVLMDIALKGQLDGIATAQIIHDTYRIPVVFLTANADDDTFQRAKATKPYAFLSKPFRHSELQRAIELALEKVAEETPHQPGVSEAPQDDIQNILPDRIFVQHKDSMVKIMLADILFVEADRNYCKLHTAQAAYLVTMPLGNLAQRLPSGDFLRVHRSYIINVLKIDAIQDHYASVRLGKHTLPVSRNFQDVLATRLSVI